MVFEILKGAAAIAVIAGLWLLVQLAWRRAFPGTPADEDALAGRVGCHGCSCAEPCQPETERDDATH